LELERGRGKERANRRQNTDRTGVLDAREEGILDLLISKQWAIKLATEAARTVLSVDQIIVARQAGGPKPPAPNPVGDSLHVAIA
jgi:T-complex protein 1 subunit theta